MIKGSYTLGSIEVDLKKEIKKNEEAATPAQFTPYMKPLKRYVFPIIEVPEQKEADYTLKSSIPECDDEDSNQRK